MIYIFILLLFIFIFGLINVYKKTEFFKVSKKQKLKEKFGNPLKSVNKIIDEITSELGDSLDYGKKGGSFINKIGKELKKIIDMQDGLIKKIKKINEN